MRWSRCFPRSLFGRNVLLLVALLIASQIAWLTLFRVMVQVPRLERLASYVLEYDALLQLALKRIPAAERPLALAEMAAREGTRLQTADSVPADFGTAPGGRIALLLAPLSRALGPHHPMHWQRDGEQRLWIKTRLDERDYWMGFATSGLFPANGRLLLAGSLVTFILSLLGALPIQRHLQRPLRQLTEAASAVARGDTPPPLSAAGPQEIAAVAASFQRMTESLSRAEQERTLMLAGVSHDLRTPLAKLRLCVEMLRSGADASLIESMIRSIDTADAVIGQFIEFARIGSDEQAQWCDPAELVTSVGNEFAGRRNCAVKLDLQPAPALRVRPVALRRAIANLVENACRYAPGEIVVGLEARDGKLRFSVLDQGPGVPAPELARIRQPFTRLTSSRGQLPGAGLGLAIVERIAALHRGQLRLENREQGGLAAMIELPAATEKEAELLGPTE